MAQIIEFKENSYKESTNKLNELVSAINSVIPFLIENDHKDISIEFFKGFINDFRKTLNEYHKKHIYDVCDYFGKPMKDYN